MLFCLNHDYLYRDYSSVTVCKRGTGCVVNFLVMFKNICGSSYFECW